MVRGLVELPLRMGVAVVAGFAGLVRSRLNGGPQRPVTWEPLRPPPDATGRDPRPRA
jgi:hypothetical protein